MRCAIACLALLVATAAHAQAPTFGPLEAHNNLSEIANAGAAAQAAARASLGMGSPAQIGALLSWTTATRPGSPVAGEWGFNTSIGTVEYWTGSAWTPIQGGAATSGNCNTLDFSGSCNAGYGAIGGLL